MSKSIEQPTLEEVSQAFKTWRDSKSYRREKTPSYLWELVRAIAPFYPRRKIEVSLSITKEQLDRESPPSGVGELSQGLKNVDNPTFIELPIPELSMIRPESTLIITRCDGSSWLISEARQEVISESLRLFLQG